MAGEVTAGLAERNGSRVYGFGYLQADCRVPGSALEPYSRFEYGTTFTSPCLTFNMDVFQDIHGKPAPEWQPFWISMQPGMLEVGIANLNSNSCSGQITTPRIPTQFFTGWMLFMLHQQNNIQFF